MGKHSFTEAAEVHRWQGRVEGTDKVFVEPLCFLEMETYSLSGRQVMYR
jgi:hypothetical protein